MVYLKQIFRTIAQSEEDMKKKYIFIALIVGSALSVAASLSLSLFFQSSEAEAQTCVALPPPIVYTSTSTTITSRNNGNWVTTALGTHRFCMLSLVEFFGPDDDLVACQIVRNVGGSWTLQVRESNDDDTRARCQAMCFD